MPILFPGGLAADVLIDRAARHLAALRRLSAGDAPSPSDLAAAPLLDLWQIARRPPASGLIGILRDAPSAGRTVLTSRLHALDARGFWALTGAGFHRLGRPADQAGRRTQ